MQYAPSPARVPIDTFALGADQEEEFQGEFFDAASRLGLGNDWMLLPNVQFGDRLGDLDFLAFGPPGGFYLDIKFRKRPFTKESPEWMRMAVAMNKQWLRIMETLEDELSMMGTTIYGSVVFRGAQQPFTKVAQFPAMTSETAIKKMLSGPRVLTREQVYRLHKIAFDRGELMGRPRAYAQ
jgi:hypothetical protein